ncbi:MULTISPECIES: hypothetical protein [Amycolatopsis]|uniref:hypothetical protein n=1 Tax=Amycolatopsis TaxID=1813 RepID=UPI000B8A8E1D|nr:MULTISPECIES: hypothetical protein [Amycolatopsis]OXM61333.1 hypothetical protein CF166_34170 [Amycolatopsis sp. KNN50.9b]
MQRRGADVVPVRWAGVGPEKLQPCGHCWLRLRGKAEAPARPCPVQDGEHWVLGTLTWEKHPRGNGMWWAAVRFSRAGELVTEERSQRAVRPHPA